MNHTNGFVLLHRKIWESKDFNNAFEISIFLFLLSKACHKPQELVYRRKKIFLNRGEVCIALRDLAKRFNTTVDKIKTALRNFAIQQNILVRSYKRMNIYIIVKYEKYQRLERPIQQNIQQNTPDRTININKNKSMYSSASPNIISMRKKKIKIDKSKIPILQTLHSQIRETPRTKSQFEIAKEKLDKYDFEEYVKLSLQESDKS
tara:strand:+ start:1999 stop:2613 length:615 start_codon:yes stop_codon:yes gene_type:complete